MDVATNKLPALFGRAALRDDSPEMSLLVEPVNFKDMLVFFNQWREKITKELLK